MKTVKADLPKDLKECEVHIFADWHIGDVHCKLDDIKAEIEVVKNTPAAYVICNGDLINNATKSSVSDCYAEEMSPMEAICFLVDLLRPIKDKILIITQGNHEARTYRTDGIDLTYMVARELGLEDVYVREGGVMFLRIGSEVHFHGRPIVYSFYVSHGSGGGRKEGAKAIRLADMSAIVDTDIYVHSHTHLPMIMRNSFYRLSYQNSSVSQCEKLFVNTASQLKYGGYGQTYEFKPSSTTNPVIYLSGKRKVFTAKL